jgi:hypothetical protein
MLPYPEASAAGIESSSLMLPYPAEVDEASAAEVAQASAMLYDRSEYPIDRSLSIMLPYPAEVDEASAAEVPQASAVLSYR